MSGLPEMYKTDWEKARQLIEDGGVLDSPWAASSCLVHSESNPKQPNGVTYTKQGIVKCVCKRYEDHHVCSHAIAVVFKKDCLQQFVLLWEPNLSRLSESTKSKKQV